MEGYIQFLEGNCKDCLRCVRNCPTKAMTYVDHRPMIVEDECILCGKCFVVCPHSAKKVRSDIRKVDKWLKEGEEVILSVAPSFAAVWPSFPELRYNLMKLGFSDVQETARGATEVSQGFAMLMKEGKMKNIISTCCPATVSLVKKEYPELTDQLAPVVSPMIAHGRLIKQEHPDALTVFITPCIAKQKEAADPEFAGAIDATITMSDLKEWLKNKPWEECTEEWQDFEGEITRIYPVPGGVVKTLPSETKNYRMVNVEGIYRVKRTLDAIKDGTLSGFFFEMSSCEESCMGGPLISHMDHNEWLGQSVIRDHVDLSEKVEEKEPSVSLKTEWKPDEIVRIHHSEQEIADMLWMMGKTSKEKELNCGCCGYETCRDKAVAVLDGKADPKLCLPYALEHALSISNLVIEHTPNGILVLDENACIQEINPSARHMLFLDSINPKGLPISSILPCEELETMLTKKDSVQYLTYRYPQYGMLLYHALIRIPESSARVLILMDQTVEEAKEKILEDMRKQTLTTAQNVIDDQMRTVQEIASLLGETTAKSKAALTKLMKAMQDDEK